MQMGWLGEFCAFGSLLCSHFPSVAALEASSFYQENTQIVVGDGARVCFWLDQWLGSHCLKYGFPRLFSLSIEKDIPLKLLVERNGYFRGYNLNFRRALFAWESEELDRLFTLLNQSLIRTYNKLDQWKWLPCSSGQFSCSSLYHLLLSSGSVGLSKMLWSNISPPKVQFLG
ncbi:hypothetical protein ACSBR2_040899 [Camellia fascicularis]